MLKRHKNLRPRIMTEERLRQIVQEEILRQHLINEGLWDDVKDGVKKLSDIVSQKFKSVVGDWTAKINEKIAELSKTPEEVSLVMSAVKEGMQKSGESLVLDDTLKIAKELSQLKALDIASSDLAGPVKEKAAQLQNSKKVTEVFDVLRDKKYTSQKKSLNELGITAVAGVGLAIMGGLPMLFSGLKKLAQMLGATGLVEVFEKARHVTHAFEEKVIDYIVPDLLSYQVYKFLNSRGFHVTKNQDLLSYEDYKLDADKSGARKKTDGLIYKVILIYFAIQGLVGVLKSGLSLLGFVEGGATAVKGAELAKGASEIAKIARGVEAAADAAGSAASAV